MDSSTNKPLTDGALTNDLVADVARAELGPKLDLLLKQLDVDSDLQALSFFTAALVSLQQAVDGADIGELFVQLSTVAFLGFEFSSLQARLVDELLAEAERFQLPTLEQLQERYLPHSKGPAIPVRQHEVISYDSLLEGQWAAQVACHG